MRRSRSSSSGLVGVHLKVRGFDKPVRDDGVAPEFLEAAQRSHGGPQGLHALVLWIGGSVLICWYIYGRAARTTVLGVSHISWRSCSSQSTRGAVASRAANAIAAAGACPCA